MAGKRLLDLALFINGSRRVLKQHIKLRSDQLDAFNKTSTLAKAVKHQTDRVTLTVKAASALASRFNESPSTYTPPSNSQASSQDESIPGTASAGVQGDSEELKEGLGQDHHYEQSATSKSVDGRVEKTLDVKQESLPNQPTPDGSIPPTGAPVSYEATGARGEFQSPSMTAEQEDATERSSVKPQGVFNERTVEVLETQTPQKSIPRRDGVIPEPEEVPEGVDANIFLNPRISKMLGPNMQSKIKAGSPAASITRFQSARSKPQGHGLSQTPKQPVTLTTSDDDVRSLAADIATVAERPPESANDSYAMRESKVPSSRFGRFWEYGGLATSMAFGAVGETFRRATGSRTGNSLMLSANNMERLVAKLSHMRGAALKLGQMMSFQDSKMLPAPIAEVLQRVQDNADYMPAYQRDKVLSEDLGSEWRSIFSSFNEKPLAAASIGQVHRAILASNGTEVAVKVQYPGVANSISSDLSNLSVLLTASRLLPKGLFLDKTIANARVELAWECDYEREAACQTRFRELLQDETDTFTVPAIVPEACGKQVLTAELMHGVGVTKPSLHLTQEQRDWIGTNVLRLCLRELTEFKFMQTDPNWTNFLFNRNTHKLELLDYGAAREYPDKFIDPYVRILIAAAKGDRETIRVLSVQLGYLTGHESRAMVNAHVQSVLTLAEPFRETQSADEVYDFRDQTITDRVRGFIPVMVRERLAPPPEETYSLHRKLSGAFLLLARLGSRVECRNLFERAIARWEQRDRALE